MKKNAIFRAIFKEDVNEAPFFVFLTLVLLAIYALSVASSAELRAPLRLIPFTLLLILHIYMYWRVETWDKTQPMMLAYLILQGGLALALVLIGRNLAMTMGLFLALIGITAGLLGLTPLGIGVIAFYLALSFVGYGVESGWTNLNFWVWSAVPMTVFVIIYVVLYNRQGEARARAQALAADLEGANRRLAEYASRVEELTLANERQRMARELHDTLSQGLAGLILQLEAVDAHLAQDHAGRAREIVELAMLQARETLADARRAIGDLRQTPPEAQDLDCSIREEAERFTAATGIPCSLDANLPGALPLGLCEVVQRSAAEGLTNVARHARASQCHLRVSAADGWLEMKLTDNGAGFDAALSEGRAGHYGLLGMRERARLAGGTLEIHSAPGAGTTLHLRLPLEEKEAAR